MKRAHLALIVIFLVILADQALKIWVKTSMYYGQEIFIIGDWFRLNFVENPGMAFGLEFGGDFGKVMLTLFRIIAVAFIGYFLYNIIQKKYAKGLIFSVALIFAGAMGNIIDSVFYGVLFEGSDFFARNVATFLPEDGGYAPLLHGKVVDMLYFPILRGTWPEWVPYFGGNDFLFFRPVFNIADSAITIGVITILVFQKRFFPQKEENKGVETESEVTSEVNEDKSGS